MIDYKELLKSILESDEPEEALRATLEKWEHYGFQDGYEAANNQWLEEQD